MKKPVWMTSLNTSVSVYFETLKWRRIKKYKTPALHTHKKKS